MVYSAAHLVSLFAYSVISRRFYHIRLSSGFEYMRILQGRGVIDGKRDGTCCVGMNKMVINHLDKLFVTSDAATIMKEMEIAQAAAKMLVMAAEMQEQEVCIASQHHVRLPPHPWR